MKIINYKAIPQCFRCVMNIQYAKIFKSPRITTKEQREFILLKIEKYALKRKTQ